MARLASASDAANGDASSIVMPVIAFAARSREAATVVTERQAFFSSLTSSGTAVKRSATSP